ncbi:3-hydroxyisobutyrate dehydrogenase [Novosphingobium sp.]|uniref:3-hydroxyisobutyrate dehydrogenase n=1 Tax=Novosphingobium sp. TaxID=1874826 RepID=UPI00333F0C7F
MAKRIAFIGLGNMGGGMAANLVAKGFKVEAFDLDAAALERAKLAGCTAHTSINAALQGVDAVVTMLPNGTIVHNVFDNDVFKWAPAGALLIDCSTIDVATARDVITQATAKGHQMVDAPVSGGIAAANAGTLTFMVGGTDAAFAAAQPILAAMGSAVIHAGGEGAGQAAKICNNMLLGATMVATSEAFAMAEKLGLDLQTFYNISSKASGQSWSMTSYCPVAGVGPKTPADNDYQGGFATALMLKDLRLAMAAATDAGADVPMGRRAAELYEAFASAGNAGLDFSAIIKTMRG